MVIFHHTEQGKALYGMDTFWDGQSFWSPLCLRAGGLGVAGIPDTRLALEMGQVDELLIAADPSTVREVGATDAGATDADADAVSDVAEDLVERARRTDARVTFIEQTDLLSDVGGVGGLLRFRVSPRDGGSTPS